MNEPSLCYETVEDIQRTAGESDILDNRMFHVLVIRKNRNADTSKKFNVYGVGCQAMISTSLLILLKCHKDICRLLQMEK